MLIKACILDSASCMKKTMRSAYEAMSYVKKIYIVNLLLELELIENGSLKVISKIIFSSKILILSFKIIYRLYKTNAYTLKTFMDCLI